MTRPTWAATSAAGEQQRPGLICISYNYSSGVFWFRSKGTPEQYLKPTWAATSAAGEQACGCGHVGRAVAGMCTLQYGIAAKGYVHLAKTDGHHARAFPRLTPLVLDSFCHSLASA